MSRPLAWNGTAWVDPAFNTAPGTYRTYEVPQYTTPVGQWTFDTGADGWSYAAGWENGAIYDDTPGGWYANVAQVNSPIVAPPLNLKPNVLIRARFLWSTTDLTGQGYADNRDIKFTFDYEESVIHLTSPNNGIQWHTHPHMVNSNEVNSNYYGELYCLVALWGTNDDVVRMYLHECRLEDANTGEPLYRLSAPGWEPKVYRSNGQWK